MIIKKNNLKKIINKMLKESRFFLSYPYEKLSDESKIELSKNWINYFNFHLKEIKKRNQSKLPIQKKEDENIIGVKQGENAYAFDIRNFKLFDLNIPSDYDEFNNIRINEYCEKNNIDILSVNMQLIDKKLSILSFIELPINLAKYFSDIVIERMNKLLKKSSITIIKSIDELKYILDVCSLVNSESTLTASKMSDNLGYPSQSFDDEDFINAKKNEDMTDFLKDIASPNTFISFVDPYEFNLEWNEGDKIDDEYLPPKFGLNPFAGFGTPHGIYAYPFDKENCKLFLKIGQPTDADFAIDRDYFHLMKIDLNNPRVVVFNIDGTSNNINTFDYFKKDYFNKIKELFRLYKLFYRDMSKDNQYIQSVIRLEEEKELHMIYEEFIDFMKKDMFAEQYQLLKNNPFYLLYRFAGYLARLQGLDSFNQSALDSDKKNKGHSEFFSLLLHSIGIDCVVDRGLGIIHINEPAQTHILTFNNSNSTIYKYLGTYKNFMKK